MTKKFHTALLFVVSCFLLQSELLFSASVPAHQFDTEATHALLIDADTQKPLLEKNSHASMFPSSMTKIITASVVVDLIRKGALNREDLFTVPAHAAKAEGSSMFLKSAQKVSVLDLLKGLIIQSGNDAAITLAENIAGSEVAFVRQMNALAKKLGASSTTHFTNASGLPDAQHTTTPADMAQFALYALRQKEFYPLYKKKEYTFNGIRQLNRNKLLFMDSQCDGIKTGHIQAAGYGIVATCKRGEQRLILVINGLKSIQQRAQEAARIMQWGFANFKNYLISKARQSVGRIKVKYGQTPEVDVQPQNDVKLTLPVNLTRTLTTKVIPVSGLQAPFQQDKVVAYYHIYDNTSASSLGRFPLYPLNAVTKKNRLLCWIDDCWERISQWF